MCYSYILEYMNRDIATTKQKLIYIIYFYSAKSHYI